MLRFGFLVALALVTTGCSFFRAPVIPLRTITLGSGDGGTCLAVLLPGRWDKPESLLKAGFAEAVEKRGSRLDLVAVDTHLGHYRDRSVVERLHLDVVAPARAAGQPVR